MQKLESELQVTLFERKKNKAELNQSGKLAVEYAGAYPDMTISSEMKDQDKLLQGLKEGVYHLIITSFPVDETDVSCQPYGEEQLFFSLPPGHALSGEKGLHFADLNGENILLYTQIGFWHDIPALKMPSAHFFLQDDDYVFRELVNASALPSFTSEIMMKKYGKPFNRIIIPILDGEAHVCYFLSCLSNEKTKLSAFSKEYIFISITLPFLTALLLKVPSY